MFWRNVILHLLSSLQARLTPACAEAGVEFCGSLLSTSARHRKLPLPGVRFRPKADISVRHRVSAAIGLEYLCGLMAVRLYQDAELSLRKVQGFGPVRL